MNFLRRNFVYVALLAVFLLFALFLREEGFLTSNNILNIVIQAAPITVMAVFLNFVLASQEIDLSLGAVVGLSGVIAAIVIQNGDNAFIASIAAIFSGFFIGLVNGLLVNQLKIPSFLSTLAMLGIVTGIARWITDLKTFSITDEKFVSAMGSGSFFGIPSLVLWTLGIVFLGHILLFNTRFGAWVLAVGDNSAAAESLGINVKKVRLLVLILGSLGASLAGLLYAGRLQSASYSIGVNDTLTVIAAAVIGGTSLFGGRASIYGALAGSVLLAMLVNGLLLAGFSVTQQLIVQGVVLILSMAVSIRGRGTHVS
ncbi:MAG: ABC transporter permease [Actinobacteria bacterium]|nr:ABC transporter permease [Actinomycetota bacterium]